MNSEVASDLVSNNPDVAKLNNGGYAIVYISSNADGRPTLNAQIYNGKQHISFKTRFVYEV